MWGNPKRERDLYRLRKVHINKNNTISSKRKYLTTPKTVPTFFLGKHAHKQLYDLYTPYEQHPRSVPNQRYMENNKKNVLFTIRNHQKSCLDLHETVLPRNPCPPSLLYRLYRLYNMSLFINQKLQQYSLRNFLGNMPTLSWEMCPLFPLSSYLKNI